MTLLCVARESRLQVFTAVKSKVCLLANDKKFTAENFISIAKAPFLDKMFIR